jgi:hypothetical protein
MASTCIASSVFTRAADTRMWSSNSRTRCCAGTSTASRWWPPRGFRPTDELAMLVNPATQVVQRPPTLTSRRCGRRRPRIDHSISAGGRGQAIPDPSAGSRRGVEVSTRARCGVPGSPTLVARGHRSDRRGRPAA